MIHVLAFITTQAGKRDEVLGLFKANVPAVLAEDGCIEYGAVIDVENAGPMQHAAGPDTFVVVEKWQSTAHLGAHAQSEHMKAYGAKTKDMLESRQIMILNPA